MSPATVVIRSCQFLCVEAVVLGVLARGMHARSYNVEYSATPWLSSLHMPFYHELHTRIRALAASGEFGPAFDVHAATAWGRGCGTPIAGLHTMQTTTERLAGVPDGSVDVSFSNAVFEHIADANATFAVRGSIACPPSSPPSA